MPSRIFFVWHLLPISEAASPGQASVLEAATGKMHTVGIKRTKKEHPWAASYLHSCSGRWCILVHNQAGTCSRSFQMCWRICGCKSRQLCQWSIHQCLQQEKGCWSDPWEGKMGKKELAGICMGTVWFLSQISLISKSYNFTLGDGFCTCSYKWSSKTWTNYGRTQYQVL